MTSVPTVLVVDDNPGFLQVVRAVLGTGSPAFAVHTVETGSQALAFLERREPYAAAPRPAFVLLDFRLPDMTAAVLLETLAARGLRGVLPILVMSQAAWEEDESAARAAGATGYAVKPSRVRALREMVVAFWRDQVHGHSDPAD
jgi:two-component system, chemotaxis family, response regulator Rcp1